MGNKSPKSAPALYLKPSVLEQMLQRDTLTHANTLHQHRLTSCFDSNGDMTARFTPPETARSEKRKPLGELRKSGLKAWVERPKVVRIEVGRCKGKVGLSYLHTERSSKSSTKPSSACRSPTSSVFLPTCSEAATPRSLQSLSPRTIGPTSQETSPVHTPRVWQPTDPSIQDLFVKELPQKAKGVTTIRQLVRKRPPESLQKSSISSEATSQGAKRSLVSVLNEVVDIQTSEVTIQRRVGVRNIIQSEEKPREPKFLGLERVVAEKEEEDRQVYRPKRRISALKKLNTLYFLQKQTTSRSSESRAEKQWLWTGSLGKHGDSEQ